MESPSAQPTPGPGGALPVVYEASVLALSIFSLVVLAADVVAQSGGEVGRLLAFVDTGICILFMGDFLVRISRAPSRWDYLVKGGWLDLISSIPVFEPFRAARIGRIIRIVRVLRALRASHRVTRAVFADRASSAAHSAGLVFVLTIVCSSITILQLEGGDGGNIKTAEDALWWSWVTITTVGYGDKFPVTTEGRVVGAILMTIGVGLFGAFTAWVAAWLVRDPRQEESDAAKESMEAKLDAVRLELRELRKSIESRGTGETDVR